MACASAVANRFLLAFALGALGAGCASSDDGVTVSYKDHEVRATATLTKVVHDDEGDFVLGTISIKGVKRPLLKADIHCFVLRIGESRNVENWTDGLMSSAGTGYLADDGEVFAMLHMPMTKFHDGTAADFHRARLERGPPPTSAQCFEFS